MKYIILESPLNIPHPIIFDDGREHSEVRQTQYAGWKLIGAGYCRINGGKFEVFGKAISLNDMESKQEDAYILNTFMTLKF